jgi:hypothetical protein
MHGWNGSSQLGNQLGQGEPWLVEQNGDLSTVTQRLRLIIRKFDGFARFLVLRQSARKKRDAEVLLSSGTATNVSTAKAAAQRTAARLESMFG